MKQLRISSLPNMDKQVEWIELSRHFDCQERHAIDIVPWPSDKYVPHVQFSIAYGTDCIFLKYYIHENDIKAIYLQPNDPVYRDSCVEFFVAFNGGPEYYNLEFNCLGTCLIGFGHERANRTLLSGTTIRKIKSQTVISTGTEYMGYNNSWELTLIIPLEIFHFHKLTTLKGETCSANFYKCGDDLPRPHYLVWNNIHSKAPDFHRPEFFGELKFV
jgi:hypothetical protein